MSFKPWNTMNWSEVRKYVAERPQNMSEVFAGKTDEHIIRFKETLLYMLGQAELELMKRREATKE